MLPITWSLPSGSSDSPTPSAPEGRVFSVEFYRVNNVTNYFWAVGILCGSPGLSSQVITNLESWGLRDEFYLILRAIRPLEVVLSLCIVLN